ncbi:MAG: hypothetical protein IJX14_03465 [Clostridia bacterium]|nr:hypothetical protein [Clostridia bacterium]
MNSRKILAMLLAALMTASVTACGAPAETETALSETAPAAETETSVETDSIEARKAVSDDVPVLDFKGEEYRVLSNDSNSAYITAEELTGDVVNDAVYNRMIDISERFNVEIVHENGGTYDVIGTTTKTTVQSGDDIYDLVASHYVQMGIDTLNNVYLDFNSVPYINFEKPWWNRSTREILTYKDITFLAFGDLTASNISASSAMFYNKSLGEEYNFGNIYDLVNEGQWTKDKMTEMCETVYRDTNGDGVKDAGDRYGYSVSLRGFADTYLWSFGKQILEPQEDGTYKDVWYDEKLVNIVEWLYDVTYNQNYTYSENTWNIEYSLFCEGNSLFAGMTLGNTTWGMRDLDLDYAIIPMPKWDEAQERHYTVVGGGAIAEAVLQTASNLEMIGAVTEAMNAEGWKELVPAYYDITLKYKGVRDEDSIAMLDQILEDRIYDFGYVYGGWNSAGGGAGFWLMEIVNSKSTDVASAWAKRQGPWENYMASVYTAFDAYIEQVNG